MIEDKVVLYYLASTFKETANSATENFLSGKLTFFPVFYDSILFVKNNYYHNNKLELKHIRSFLCARFSYFNIKILSLLASNIIYLHF